MPNTPAKTLPNRGRLHANHHLSTCEIISEGHRTRASSRATTDESSVPDGPVRALNPRPGHRPEECDGHWTLDIEHWTLDVGHQRRCSRISTTLTETHAHSVRAEKGRGRGERGGWIIHPNLLSLLLPSPLPVDAMEGIQTRCCPVKVHA